MLLQVIVLGLAEMYSRMNVWYKEQIVDECWDNQGESRTGRSIASIQPVCMKNRNRPHLDC